MTELAEVVSSQETQSTTLYGQNPENLKYPNFIQRIREGIGKIALSAALVMSGGVITAIATEISHPEIAAAGTDDYPSKWKDVAMDTMFDDWGEYNRECTSFVAFRLHARNGFEMPFYANATDWKAKAQAMKYTVDNSPATGAVAWTSTHVAWVESVSADKSKVTVEEYDELDTNKNGKYGDDGTYDERTTSANSFQYIHFKDISSISNNQSKRKSLNSDFNNDGSDDVAWHQGSTLHLLVSNGSKLNWVGSNSSNAPIGTPDWAGAGDVNGDGKAEAIWYHASAGTIYNLDWNETTWQVLGSVSGIGNPDHAVVGDFNGDSYADLAWHQGSKLFLLTGRPDGSFGYGGSNPDNAPIGTPDWAGAGNIDGTGPSEVYWHQGSTLYVFRWLGSTWGIVGSTSGIGSPDHAITGDFNNDRSDDIVWHQGNMLYLFGSDGKRLNYVGANNPNSPIGVPDWAGAGNIDGTGPSEVYWHQGSTLYVFRWLGSTWGVVGYTSGLGQPDRAVSAG